MAVLIAVPILGILAVLQSAIVSTMPLLHGTADIVLLALLGWALQERVTSAVQWALIGGLFMSIMSGLPVGAYLGSYLAACIIARMIRQRVWKVPFLGMLAATFTGTLIVLFAGWVSRWLSGVYIPILTAINLIMLPAILLNLLLAIPSYFIMRDVAIWLHPIEIEP